MIPQVLFFKRTKTFWNIWGHRVIMAFIITVMQDICPFKAFELSEDPLLTDSPNLRITRGIEGTVEFGIWHQGLVSSWGRRGLIIKEEEFLKKKRRSDEQKLQLSSKWGDWIGEEIQPGIYPEGLAFTLNNRYAVTVMGLLKVYGWSTVPWHRPPLKELGSKHDEILAPECNTYCRADSCKAALLGVRLLQAAECFWVLPAYCSTLWKTVSVSNPTNPQ